MSDQLSFSHHLAYSMERESARSQACRAFLHSLIQSPFAGITQMADEVLGTNVLPSVTLVNAPLEAKFAGMDWHAQQIGQAVGMVPWIVGLHKCSSKAVNATIAKLEARGVVAPVKNQPFDQLDQFLSRKTVVGLGASSLSGFTYGAVLTPHNQGEDSLMARSINGTTSALTFGTLSLSARRLELYGLKNRTLGGIAAGLPAGIVAAETHSLLTGKGHASANDLATSIYGFSIVGGGFGLMHGRTWFPNHPPKHLYLKLEAAQAETVAAEAYLKHANEKLKLANDNVKLADANVKLADANLKLANDIVKLTDAKNKLADANLELLRTKHAQATEKVQPLKNEQNPLTETTPTENDFRGARPLSQIVPETQPSSNAQTAEVGKQDSNAGRTDNPATEALRETTKESAKDRMLRERKEDEEILRLEAFGIYRQAGQHYEVSHREALRAELERRNALAVKEEQERRDAIKAEMENPTYFYLDESNRICVTRTPAKTPDAPSAKE